MELGSANMLSYLDKKINEIIPINGLILLDDGSITINFIEEPTSEQQNQINNLINSWPLDSAKISKLEQVENEWKTTVSNGWETQNGWKLGIDIQDVTLLTGAFMLSKEAAALGINDPVHIIDMSGESHSLNLQELTTLMLQYGNARSQLSSQYANRVKSVKEATSIEQLESI
jgi:hypothetical protein